MVTYAKGMFTSEQICVIKGAPEVIARIIGYDAYLSKVSLQQERGRRASLIVFTGSIRVFDGFIQYCVTTNACGIIPLPMYIGYIWDILPQAIELPRMK